eukprot:GILJ01007044.1.p1 GENE.GILJ01007044.1~~GILJ01007044.1.p1  ORF type:complete len:305 (+),score=42.23 GILJ01007044.1:40-915(+)
MSEPPSQESVASVDSLVSNGDGEHNEEVRTLFISGFPADVKEREIYNLFRPSGGFESATIKPAGAMAVAFASFATQAQAAGAKEAVNGIIFDPAANIPLRVDFARSNTKAKRGRTGGQEESSEKRMRAYVEPGVQNVMLPPHMYPLNGLASGLNDATSLPHVMNPTRVAPNVWNQSYTPAAYLDPYRSVSMPPARVPVSARRPLLPCSTLFVANLSAYTTEEELSQLFVGCNGFKKLQLNRPPSGTPVAFVEFHDVSYSSAALSSLNGYALPTAGEGGLRIQYAKSKMGAA